jgi:hypothetical protein
MFRRVATLIAVASATAASGLAAPHAHADPLSVSDKQFLDMVHSMGVEGPTTPCSPTLNSFATAQLLCCPRGQTCTDRARGRISSTPSTKPRRACTAGKRSPRRPRNNSNCSSQANSCRGPLLATAGRCRYGCGRLRHQTAKGTWRRWGLDALHNHQCGRPWGAPVYGAPV